ncbi:MAG: catalase [Rhizonema sp. PD37]|nr:catalase [Rhizonema sp. PD37]
MKFPRFNLKKNLYLPVVMTLALLIILAVNNNSASAKTPLTLDNGAAVGDNQNSLTAGPNGPVLLQDVHLIEKLARFDRERIPERVVHARGTGVHGEFISDADLSGITMAAPFQKAGKKTPVFVRFSSVIHPQGSPETLRDPRGFSTKFYTDKGNWDLVGNNLPVFFIRDAMKFPDMIHALKPSPITNKQDPNRVFDFFSHVPESTNMLTYLYSDMGTPASYREMDGASVHAYKFINSKGEYKYVKFTWKTKQGMHNFTGMQAQEMQAKDFNIHTTDLYGNIERGNYPAWDLYIQTLNPQDLDKFAFNPLDATKIWPTNLVAMRKVGTLTLNKMPENFFQETEQSAFAPSNLIPGIEPSEDRLLQGRIFSYADTQRHRLGVNNLELAINKPRVQVNNENQDGFANYGNTKSDVNYEPSQKPSSLQEDSNYRYSQLAIAGKTQQQRIQKTLNFEQAGELYRSFDKKMQDDLIANLKKDLGTVKDVNIRTQITAFFYNADPEYGTRVAQAVNLSLDSVKQRAAEVK